MVNDTASSDPIRPDAVLLDLTGRTKAEVLRALAARAAALAGREPLDLARALTERETLGSTGVGSGVALPHASLDELVRPVVLFARLAGPIDWEAIDDRPVDLVLAVFSPARGAAPAAIALSRFARLLRNEATRARLRSGGEADIVADLTA